jgi:aldehyde:ferredoxin oxidoreductase
MPKANGFGFTGKMLHVNLTQKKLSDAPTPVDWARQFIGGSGLAARVLYPLLKRDTDPLGPDNPLLVMAGPFTGTEVPSGSRISICGRSPLTRLWGECCIGGNFGARLRHAGYDGILITGQAAEPTVMTVLHGAARLQDGKSLWTHRTYETLSILRKDIHDARMASLVIGPAGENLVTYANIMSEGGRAAGRMGLGAVMGSKRLKAIVAAGDTPVPVAKADAIIKLARPAIKTMMEDFMTTCYRDMGTATGVGAAQEIGAMPNKYWTQGEFPTHDKISGSTMLERFTVGHDGCYRCPIQCGRVVEIPEGEYKLTRTKGPEYESLGALGSMILCDNLEAVIYAAHLCDDLGLDTITCGNAIGFAYYLMDQGKLTKKDAGMKLEWGDPKPQHALIPLIAARQGFGAVLAEGTRAMGERYKAADLAVHVKGLEVACWDPRALFGMAAIYATSPRGGCHLDGDMYMVLQGQVYPELGIDADDPQTDEAMGEVAARAQSWRMVSNALVMCQFASFLIQEISQFYTLTTGISATPQDLLHIGDRIVTLKRLINLNLGLTPKDDILSPLLRKPLAGGGTRGMVPDVDRQIREYYAYRGWDPKSGRPSTAKLVELGLDRIAS